MTCQEFLRALDPYLDDELPVLEVLRIQEHLRDCGRCRTVADSEGVLHSLLAGDAIQDDAPPALRERILQRVAGPPPVPTTSARPRGRFASRRTLLAGVGLVGLVLVALVIPGLRGRGDVPPFVEEITARHRLYTEAPAPTLDLPTPDIAHLTGWLASRLGYPIHAPRPVGPSERLVGGRTSSVAGVPAAYLLYEWGGHRLSVFVMSHQAGTRLERAERMVEGVELYTTALHGLNVVWWEDTDRLYVVVSAAPSTELEAFAVRCVRSGGAQGATDRDREAHDG
jgi:mycothiol system anti-sigma-R factor